jgi:hypothetical protein
MEHSRLATCWLELSRIIVLVYNSMVFVLIAVLPYLSWLLIKYHLVTFGGSGALIVPRGARVS